MKAGRGGAKLCGDPQPLAADSSRLVGIMEIPDLVKLSVGNRQTAEVVTFLSCPPSWADLAPQRCSFQSR